ncbi:hypothetical protein DL96DRAFT_1668827 [Flagelloscypha sp. PMI_526]|nr:hypothetical protein DL96DRAFT_1668827 [Flagelloscypha sp. PMI_526]
MARAKLARKHKTIEPPLSSWVQFLIHSQSLASETRRKHPDIREAADKSIAILKANPSSDTLIYEPTIIQPVFMSLSTKNAKIISISLSSLQRLIALHAVPPTNIPDILRLMADAMNMGVDIQLRILQTLVGLITGFRKNVHGNELGDALLLCFRLQESKIAVVSSTAAATLRQLVMFVVDKMVEEDKDPNPGETRDVRLPDGTAILLAPSARDVFYVFQDLCLLANSEKPSFLKLDFLHKTFALELIESVLTNYYQVIREHNELLLLLRHHLCPLLLKSISPTASSSSTPFALTVRCTRVIFLLLKQFLSQLETEGEVFLVLLIKLIENTEAAGAEKWMRVLAMEVMRGLCSDPSLIRSIYSFYDLSSEVLSTFLRTLQKTLTSHTTLLGTHPAMSLGNVEADKGAMSVFGVVAGAAGSIVAAASGSSSGSGGLSLSGSGMRVQCIDQLDKADPPPIPETYVYLLALQALNALCDGLSSFVAPLFKSYIVSKSNGKAPRPFTLPSPDPALAELNVAKAILTSVFPSLHSSFISILQTNLADELFAETLGATQALTNTLGMVGLSSERDALLCGGIARFAVPERVLSSALEGGIFLGCALFLCGTFDRESWGAVLQVVWSADFVLTSPGMATPSSTTGSSSRRSSMVPQQPLSGGDVDQLLANIQIIFDASKSFEDACFADFAQALSGLANPFCKPCASSLILIAWNLIRFWQKTISVNEFALSKLGSIAKLNVVRLIHDVGWDTITGHLLEIIQASSSLARSLPSSIRIHGARVLDDLLVLVPRSLSPEAEISLREDVQGKVFNVLGKQVISVDSADEKEERTITIELKRMGLDCLLEILRGSGHTLVVGWESIFDMLGSVCTPATESAATPTTSTMPTKHQLPLIKSAFQSLTLICDSAVSSLSPAHLQLAIATLGKFGKQADTNIALTAAASLLWNVSDVVMARRKAASSRENAKDEEEEYSRLWTFLLLEVLGLCGDSRPEVRDGAIQTLFRTMQLYGDTLSRSVWDQVVWKVAFPLFELLSERVKDASDADASAWTDSMTLAINSFGSILNAFLVNKIIHLDKFETVWDRFIGYMEATVLELDSLDIGGKRRISTPAFRCIEKALKASLLAKDVAEARGGLEALWHRGWESVDKIGSTMLDKDSRPKLAVPLCQDSLVALVDIVKALRSLSRSLDGGAEWPLDRLTRLMAILKGVITYPDSLDYRPDIDALSPVQDVVMSTMSTIDLAVPGVSSVIMRDLAEYATLPFLAAFDVPTESKSTPQRRVTYIALIKSVMPLLQELFLKFRDDGGIYNNGTVEDVLSAFSIPIKMKYSCPAASKHGKDEPLWKTATTCFLKIVTVCTQRMSSLGEELALERLEGIWRQLLDVFKGGILADWCDFSSTPAHFIHSFYVQEDEENFDLALVSSLEAYVVPYLGSERVPDSTSRHSLHRLFTKGECLLDAPEVGKAVPRERFSYWCFDLLFEICSNNCKADDFARRRLAVLSLPSLLNRCKGTLLSYVADEAIRGNLPFSRAREDELNYVLRKLLRTRLYPGTLWAAFSEAPTSHCLTQPGKLVPFTVLSHQLIFFFSNSHKRTDVAHLFHFYHVLCQIVSIPRKAPMTWLVTPPSV